MKTKIIAICGPTASGKSDFALQCMNKYGGIIINGDSRQIYKGFPILTACPEEKNNHFLYEIYDPSSDRITVYKWIEKVKSIIENINTQYIWIVGGTGFYIDSLKNGVYEIPQENNLESILDISYENLYAIDQKYASSIHRNDINRITKAINIYNETGRTLSSLNRIGGIDMSIIYLDRNDLLERIKIRTDIMFKSGIVEEVEKHFAMNMIVDFLGLEEIRKYISGFLSLNEAKEIFNRKTIQYVKKQRTWFNNHYYDKKITELTDESLDNIIYS